MRAIPGANASSLRFALHSPMRRASTRICMCIPWPDSSSASASVAMQHLVAIGRVGAGQPHRACAALPAAMHFRVDLAAAHGEMIVPALVVLAGEEVFLGFLDVLGRQACLEVVSLILRHHRFHPAGHFGRHAGHVQLLDGDFGLPQARRKPCSGRRRFPAPSWRLRRALRSLRSPSETCCNQPPRGRRPPPGKHGDAC